MIALALHGGPLDGAVYTRSEQPGPFIWVDSTGRCWTAPGRHRHLYQFAKRGRNADGNPGAIYRYVGYHVAHCTGCGWYGPRRNHCTMCGQPLRSRV